MDGHASKDSEAGTGTLKDAHAIRFSIKSPVVDSGVGAGRSGSPYTFDASSSSGNTTQRAACFPRLKELANEK